MLVIIWFLNCYLSCDYHRYLLSSILWVILINNYCQSAIINKPIRGSVSPCYWDAHTTHIKMIRFCWVRIIDTTNKQTIIHNLFKIWISCFNSKSLNNFSLLGLFPLDWHQADLICQPRIPPRRKVYTSNLYFFF